MANKTTAMVLTIGARVGGKAVNLVVFLVLARGLSVEDLGLFGFVFTTVIVMVSAFDVGVRNSVAYFIGRRPELVATLTVQTLLLWGLLSAAATVTLFGILQAGTSALGSPQLIVPSCVLLVAMLLLRMGQGVLLGQGRIGFYNQTELVSRLVLAGAVGSLLGLGRITLESALWAMAASYTVGATVLALGLVHVARGGDVRDASAARLLLRRGFVFMVAVLLMTAANRVAFLILSQLGHPDEIGVFYGLQRLTEVLTEIALAVALVGFSQSVREPSVEVAVREAAHSTRLSIGIFAAMALVAAILAPWLVPLALGASFSGTDGLFRLILLGTLAGSVWTMLFPSLSAIASPGLCIRIFLPNVLCGAALSALAYLPFGIWGMAWGFVVANTLLSLSFLMAFRFKYSTPISDFLIPRAHEMLEPLSAVRSAIRKRVGRAA